MMIPDQVSIRASLDDAAATGRSFFYWKQYGVKPLPPSGLQESDIGHAVPWEAPNETAADIVSFITNGRPTPDLYRADGPNNLTRIVTEPGRAIIVNRR
jgi:hypothetical protein